MYKSINMNQNFKSETIGESKVLFLLITIIHAPKIKKRKQQTNKLLGKNTHKCTMRCKMKTFLSNII